MDHLYQGKQGPNWWANVRRNFFVSWVFSTWRHSWLEFSLKKLIPVAPWFGQSWLHVRMEFVECPHIWVDLSPFDSSQQVLNPIYLAGAGEGKEQKVRNIECINIQQNYHQSPIKSELHIWRRAILSKALAGMTCAADILQGCPIINYKDVRSGGRVRPNFIVKCYLTENTFCWRWNKVLRRKSCKKSVPRFCTKYIFAFSRGERCRKENFHQNFWNTVSQDWLITPTPNYELWKLIMNLICRNVRDSSTTLHITYQRAINIQKIHTTHQNIAKHPHQIL